MTQETVTVTIEGEETSDELTMSAGLLDMLREEHEPAAQIVGDIAMMGMAQRIHGTTHHADGEVDDAVQAADDVTMELFEERFGRSFAELTGHDH